MCNLHNQKRKGFLYMCRRIKRGPGGGKRIILKVGVS